MHLALVQRIGDPADIVFRREPVGQAHGAVGLDLQALSQFANGYPLSAGKAFDRKHGLMLLRTDSRRPGSLFAETQELSERVPELGERFVMSSGDGTFGSHARVRTAGA